MSREKCLYNTVVMLVILNLGGFGAVSWYLYELHDDFTSIKNSGSSNWVTVGQQVKALSTRVDSDDGLIDKNTKSATANANTISTNTKAISGNSDQLKNFSSTLDGINKAISDANTLIASNKKATDLEVATVTALLKGKADQSGVDANTKSLGDATAAIAALSTSLNATTAALNKTIQANMVLVQSMNTTLQAAINSVGAAQQSTATKVQTNTGQLARNGQTLLGLSTQVVQNQKDIGVLQSKCCNKSNVDTPSNAFKTAGRT